MNTEQLRNELTFQAVRSSGAGGQHVNKVSSKVILYWNCSLSTSISDSERELIFQRLRNRLTKEGVLILAADESRSQIKNKEIAVNRLFVLLKQTLHQDKARIKTKIPKAVLRKNKEYKLKQSQKKILRKPPKEI